MSRLHRTFSKAGREANSRLYAAVGIEPIEIIGKLLEEGADPNVRCVPCNSGFHLVRIL
jgi:hypothetical protein